MRPLITCEHARPDVPDGLDLGVAHDVLHSHVSYDRGARTIAARVAEELAAPLHLGGFSRLVVDLNRMEDNPAVIAAESWGVEVLGNRRLSAEQRAARIARYHRPYRDAARADAQRIAQDQGCFHLSVHSFDPALDPARRTFDCGVLYDPSREPERALASALVDALTARGFETRHNEPYAGTPEGLTSWLRAQLAPERYVGIEIEANQLWMDRAGALEGFADGLSDAVRVVLATPPRG